MWWTYKFQLDLTNKQIEIHRKTESVCRFLYNKFLYMNYKMYKLKGKKLFIITLQYDDTFCYANTHFLINKKLTDLVMK